MIGDWRCTVALMILMSQNDHGLNFIHVRNFTLKSLLMASQSWNTEAVHCCCSRVRLCPSVQATRFSASCAGTSWWFSISWPFCFQTFIFVCFHAVVIYNLPASSLPLDRVNRVVVSVGIWICHCIASLLDSSAPTQAGQSCTENSWSKFWCYLCEAALNWVRVNYALPVTN